MELRHVAGVALVVRCLCCRKYLFVEERENKPHLGKRAGMLSLPMDTLEDGNIPQEMRRLIREEIGSRHFPILSGFTLITTPLVWRYPNGTTICTIHIGCVDVSEQFCATPEASDVVPGDWYCERGIGELAQSDMLRLEVPPVLKHVQHHMCTA